MTWKLLKQKLIFSYKDVHGIKMLQNSKHRGVSYLSNAIITCRIEESLCHMTWKLLEQNDDRHANFPQPSN